jgi:hypothetical protein
MTEPTETQMLRELLAVIHRDGGHMIEDVGLVAAYRRAMVLSTNRIHNLSELSMTVHQIAHQDVIELVVDPTWAKRFAEATIQTLKDTDYG